MDQRIIIARLNIEHFRHRLAEERDETTRQTIRRLLAEAKAEIAHLKMTLEPEDAGLGDLAVINLVRNDYVPELSQGLTDWLDAGKLIINCRAEGSPDTLNSALTAALTEVGKTNPNLFLRLEHLEHFRPGEPKPTHRDRDAV